MADWNQVDTGYPSVEAAEAPAATLSPRAGWLLRALTAVDVGRRDDVTRVAQGARDAGHEDIATALEALAAPPPSLDAVMAAPIEDAEDDEDASLPGLLRMLALARAGVDALPWDTLVTRAEDRPVLRATLGLLSDGGASRVFRSPLIEHLLPRADQIRIAAQLLAQHGTINNATIARAFDTPRLDFDPTRWPDLREALHPRAILRWSRGEGPWTSMLTQALRVTLQQAGEQTQRRVLSALLQRLERDLPAGRLRGQREAVWAAQELAARLDGLDALAEQLRGLELRLEWLEEDAPPGELLESLWTHATDLDTDARLVVARALLDGPAEHPNPGVMMGAQLFLMAHLPDPREAAAVLGAGAWGAPAPMIEQGLQQMRATDVRVAFLMAMHALLNGDTSAALGAVAELVEEGETLAAQSLFFGIVQHHQLSDLPLDVAALTSSFEALAATEASLDYTPLIVSSLQSLGVAPGSEYRDGVLASLEALEDDSPRAVAARIYCGHALDDADGARGRLRAFGRALRRADDGSEQAAEALAWVLFWADPAEREAIEALVMPLTRFLLKDGPESALVAAVRCSARGEAVLRGLVQWYLWARETLGEDRRWLDLCCRVVLVPESLASVGARIVEQALTDSPMTLEALRASVHEHIGALLREQESG